MRSLPTFASALPATSALSEMTCIDGYYHGNVTVIFTTPYTYAQVISIIGSFRNITWSGSPCNTRQSQRHRRHCRHSGNL
jgi:hypothetical protein